ncbi:MAG: DeoR/GlpR family DNA-binding transcription regulator [Bryobacteraceae bacterium]
MAHKEGEVLFREERQARILKILERDGRAGVGSLSQLFEVSEDTIRRDLRDLESRGLIRKTHGGALPQVAAALPYEARLQEVPLVKQAIGRRAAELIVEGDSVIIDSGTTTLSLAEVLNVHNVRVLTNSLEIARVIATKPRCELIVLGGRYDPVHHELVGPTTVEQLGRYRVDKLFMGLTAIDPKHGITDDSEADAMVKRAMIEVAGKVITVADHTKLNRMAFSKVAPADVIHTMVTDERAHCAPFAQFGWEVITVPIPADSGQGERLH